MSGKSKKAATDLQKKLPDDDSAADDPVLPCQKNKDPQLKVKVFGRLQGKKRYVQATVTANALSQAAAAKTGLADFSYVATGKHTVAVAAVLAPDDQDFFAPDNSAQEVTLPKGKKQTLEFEVLPRNIVTPKIEVEYKVVLMDRQLGAHQAGGTTEKLWTLVEVSYTETLNAYPFSQDVDFSAGATKVYTDEGIVGIGECSGWPRVIETAVQDLKRILIGEDPTHIERL